MKPDKSSGLAWAAYSDVGRKREANEDAFLVDPELGLYVVCDGMGGHASGEEASSLAADEIHRFFEALHNDAPWPIHRSHRGEVTAEEVVASAIRYANDAVCEASSTAPELRGMGTTIVVLAEHGEDILLGHVGDSRIYRWRAGALEQMTRDHSLLNHLIDSGSLSTPDEIENFSRGNVIMRAVGMSRELEVETAIEERRKGDIYLLCSDGLSDMVRDHEVGRLFARHGADLDRCARALVEAANAAGGRDNITVMLVRVDSA